MMTGVRRSVGFLLVTLLTTRCVPWSCGCGNFRQVGEGFAPAVVVLGEEVVVFAGSEGETSALDWYRLDASGSAQRLGRRVDLLPFGGGWDTYVYVVQALHTTGTTLLSVDLDRASLLYRWSGTSATELRFAGLDRFVKTEHLVGLPAQWAGDPVQSTPPTVLVLTGPTSWSPNREIIAVPLAGTRDAAGVRELGPSGTATVAGRVERIASESPFSVRWALGTTAAVVVPSPPGAACLRLVRTEFALWVPGGGEPCRAEHVVAGWDGVRLLGWAADRLLPLTRTADAAGATSSVSVQEEHAGALVVGRCADVALDRCVYLLDLRDGQPERLYLVDWTLGRATYLPSRLTGEGTLTVASGVYGLLAANVALAPDGSWFQVVWPVLGPTEEVDDGYFEQPVWLYASERLSFTDPPERLVLRRAW